MSTRPGISEKDGMSKIMGPLFDSRVVQVGGSRGGGAEISLRAGGVGGSHALEGKGPQRWP